MSQDKFIRRSLRQLSSALAALGHAACPTTVAEWLRELGYNLRVNRKRLTGPYHPDRDRQFHYIESIIEEFRMEGWPILSVDTKKKELVGNFANGGVVWVKEPWQVNAHDFLSDALYRAVPYGLYDLLANKGHVVLAEAALMGLFGAVIGFVVGLFIEWYTIRLILPDEAGFVFPMLVAWIPAGVVFGLSVVLAALVGVWPAYHATRLRIAEAIAYE
jgi:hypothetical protein